MAIRNRGYYRDMRKKHIRRKKRIVNSLGMYWYPHDGQFSKGKIHCSCPLCRGKDIRGRHIKTSQEINSENRMKDYLVDF